MTTLHRFLVAADDRLLNSCPPLGVKRTSQTPSIQCLLSGVKRTSKSTKQLAGICAFQHAPQAQMNKGSALRWPLFLIACACSDRLVCMR